MIIPYNASKEERDKIIKEREKRLYQSFENMRKQIDEKIQTMNFSTVSEKVKRQQLEEIRHSLQEQLQRHYNTLESGLKDDMVDIGQSVLSESESFYKALNMPIGMSITSFPVEIMNNVVNGSVYDEKWYLSRALWGDYTEKLDQINEVISNGIGLNLSSLEIAKQLEQYVDPSAMTPSKTIVTHCLQDPVTGKLYSKDYVKRHPEKDWSGFKEKDSRFRYGKVDYNAQRLARTLVSHAYQQNVVQQAKANPFATGVKWLASGGERMCEICEERDGKIFPADDVPLDHPNGMCTFEVVTNLSMMEMSDVLANWVNGNPTTYDDALNAWYNDRAETHIERTPDMFAQHVIAEGKDISQEWHRRPDQYDFEIEDVMAAQGFDGKPRVASAEEFNAAVKEANGGQGFIAQRTYSASDQETLDMYRDMLYDGKWYVDCGTGGAQYGQGMYCAADYNGVLSDGIKAEMQHYQEVGNERIRKYDPWKISDEQEKKRMELVDTLFDKYDYSSYKTYSKDSIEYKLSQEIEFLSNASVEEYIEKYHPDLLVKHYTETFTLDPSAKIIKYNDLTKMYDKEKVEFLSGKKLAEIEKSATKIVADRQGKTEEEKNALYKILRQYMGHGMDEGLTRKEALELREKYGYTSNLLSLANKVKNEASSLTPRLPDNIGAYAATKGYDAINAEGHGSSGSYTVVLNRTKLIIKEPDE